MALIEGIKNQVRRVLGLSDTPHRTALAFALGVFIAFSPALGFHTLLALFLAWIFGLNRVAVLFGAFVNNPWTFTPITITSTWFGIELCCKAQNIPRINWEVLTFSTLGSQLKSYLFPFVLGSTILGLIFGLIAYFFMYGLVLQYRKMLRLAEMKRIGKEL